MCLIPTTIGGLLSAVGVAGMSRMMQANVIATSGRAVEAAGDVDVLLLDKTGTITLGNRQASAFLPAPGVSETRLARAALLASLADETPEGRSIVDLASRIRVDDRPAEGALFLRLHRPDADERRGPIGHGGAMQAIRKGAVDAVRKHVQAHGGSDAGRSGCAPPTMSPAAAARRWRCARATRVLGIVELKDIVKTDIKERFGELRRMGIKTVMITGDNKLTAAAIAAEAGVDDFLAEATPEDKLALIRQYQAEGRLVAMTGDGTNDAPALAQADVAVAMGSGTQAAKEAGNMVDLDSNPTKLLEVVETGKALLMTRGSLTTFSIANDVAKYFAIIPAIFVSTYPQLAALNVMGLASPSVRHPVGGDLQRADHRLPDPAGAQGREVPRRRRRSAAAPQSVYLRPGRPGRALRRHQGSSTWCWPPSAWFEESFMNTLLRPAARFLRACLP